MTPRDEIETLRLAVQFMTRLPVPAGAPYDPSRMAGSIRYYPLTGLLVGGMAALVLLIASCLWAMPVAIVLGMLTATLMTGALHEDGFADMVDGFWGGHTVERRLEIMRDSRLGSYGALGLILLVVLNIAALMSFTSGQAAVALLTAHMLSRLGVVVVMDRGTYVRRTGAGQDVQKGPGGEGWLVIACTLVPGLIAALMCFGLLLTALSMTLAVVISLAFLKFSERKIGGYTGDVLGAVQQLTCLIVILTLSL
ncbi:adenosylcobinamide-GDP ribazoletransferase [Halocynthiibacter styelae]|uniref:Adenosylcobinamide-GDP ribazoletransferase n=1 Tax=Halocynthiibacter styelae TaxID=2761955 RepID=A0A8J7LNX6_9RHOB|nr:adenosylcobinamide-GDP ribazoletransferase [Paenihalocynthiibacter styelae]MBI1492761.1 adenosylcobinamide-GDP ribazoletransferase [Paenihalocynthiibacter styelae]